MCRKMPENVVKERKKMDVDNPLDPILDGIARSLDRRRRLLARLQAVGRDLEDIATDSVLQQPIGRGRQLLAALQAARIRNDANRASDPPLAGRHQEMLRLLQTARRLRASANPPAAVITTVDPANDDPRIVRGEQILDTLRAARIDAASPQSVITTSPIVTVELSSIPRGRPAVLRMLGLIPPNSG